jgi:FKBP-type peptidyl-prolyl cis-trans isomerase
MRKFSYLLLAVIVLTACQQNFKKGEKGLEYKIITADGSGPKVKMGDFMQMHICQILNNGKTDTLLNDTRTTSGPIIEKIDSANIPAEYFKILSQMKKGDSLVIRMLTDSMFAQSPGSMPPFMKKGNYFYTTVKLLNIFTTQAQMDSARAAEMVIKIRKDSIENIAIAAKQDKEIQTYLKKNNITNAQKTASGVYVQITQPGTGANIDTSVVVKVNYTGMTLDGKVFDSNTDSSKGHVEELPVNMTKDNSLGNSVITGWMDGLKMLNKGAKARFVIPSPLAYGKQQMGEDIKPNSILVFDVEIKNVLTKAEAKADMEKANKERKQKQEEMMAAAKKASEAAAKKGGQAAEEKK